MDHYRNLNSFNNNLTNEINSVSFICNSQVRRFKVKPKKKENENMKHKEFLQKYTIKVKYLLTA